MSNITVNGKRVLFDRPAATKTLDARKQSAATDFAALAALANKTPAQVEAYIQANVTDLASAKAVLVILGKAVAALARRGDITD